MVRAKRTVRIRKKRYWELKSHRNRDKGTAPSRSASEKVCARETKEESERDSDLRE